MQKKVEDLDVKDCSFYFDRKMISVSVEKHSAADSEFPNKLRFIVDSILDIKFRLENDSLSNWLVFELYD